MWNMGTLGGNVRCRRLTQGTCYPPHFSLFFFYFNVLLSLLFPLQNPADDLVGLHGGGHHHAGGEGGPAGPTSAAKSPTTVRRPRTRRLMSPPHPPMPEAATTP